MRLRLLILILLLAACKPEEKITYKMTVEPSELSFPVEGGSATVVVNSELSWSARCSEDWVSAAPSRGLKGTTEVRITVAPNSDAARSVKLVFASPNDISTAPIKITQAKREGAIDASDVPDKTGMTIKGLVVCDGKGVAGAIVSDGVETAQTDADGRFWLASKKQNGYVFLSVPAGYKVPCDGAHPLFWQTLTAGSDEIEAHKFTIVPEDQSRVRLIAAADLHLADRYSGSDLHAYAEDYLPRLKETADCGKPAYSIVLGDMTWDIFWENYDLPRYRSESRSLPVTTWHVIGNHDYDMSVRDDFKAARKYVENLGPTYYSFNLGAAHFVVLDNIVYINSSGSRNHDTYVDDQQLSWLAKDLSYVSSDTPLFVCMHCALYHTDGISKSGAPALGAGFSPAGRANALVNCLRGFKEVHLLAGDTHINNSLPPEVMPASSSNIYQHNIAAVCASWWWTTYESGNSICKDGSEGGFEVFDLDGKDISWYYQPLQYPADKQFRCYDMNEIKAYFANNPGAARFLNAYPTRENYSKWGENLVLINIWAWDPRWNISVTENGKALEYEFVYTEDPLHTMSYDIPRTVENGEITSSFRTTPTHHMVRVKASGPSSPLEITVTDPFGRTYRETTK